jgi:hypothetical protein
MSEQCTETWARWERVFELEQKVAALEERLGGQSLKITQLGMDAEDDRERLDSCETLLDRDGRAIAALQETFGALEARLVVPQSIPSAWSEIGADPTVTCSPQQEGWEMLPASPLAARFAALPEKVQEWEVKGERFADFDPEDPKECYCWSRAGCVITDGGLTTLPGLASNFLEAAELIAAHMAAREEAK